MLRLYIPAAVVVVLIAIGTGFEAHYSDRFTSSSISAEEFGKRFANVPEKVGPWVGTDTDEQSETLEQAGAVSHVSRTYVNGENGRRVDLWLIVGHAREICRHTPDICYPSHGFAQLGNRLKHRIDAPGENPATFFTAKFRDESALGGQQRTRVFWAWNGNNPNKNQTDWEAPEYQKLHFGNNTALYKMYFTANMDALDEPVEDSVAIDFAKLMIPEVNRALFPERYKDEVPTESDPADDRPAVGDEAAASDEAPAEPAEAAPGETSGHAPEEETTVPAEDATTE
jgi:hypothetical protein